MLLPVLLIFIQQFLSAQGTFDVIMEDIIIVGYNKEYFTEIDAFVDDTNAVFINGSIIKQLPTEAKGHLVLMGASMGEYVISTGIDEIVDLCEILKEPIFMGPVTAAMGFDPDNCPPDVGVYATNGYRLEMNTLPDYFPPNKYKVDLEILHEEDKLLHIQVFATIVN